MPFAHSTLYLSALVSVIMNTIAPTNMNLSASTADLTLLQSGTPEECRAFLANLADAVVTCTLRFDQANDVCNEHETAMADLVSQHTQCMHEGVELKTGMETMRTELDCVLIELTKASADLDLLIGLGLTIPKIAECIQHETMRQEELDASADQLRGQLELDDDLVQANTKLASELHDRMNASRRTIKQAISEKMTRGAQLESVRTHEVQMVERYQAIEKLVEQPSDDASPDDLATRFDAWTVKHALSVYFGPVDVEVNGGKRCECCGGGYEDKRGRHQCESQNIVEKVVELMRKGEVRGEQVFVTECDRDLFVAEQSYMQAVAGLRLTHPEHLLAEGERKCLRRCVYCRVPTNGQSHTRHSCAVTFVARLFVRDTLADVTALSCSVQFATGDVFMDSKRSRLASVKRELRALEPQSPVSPHREVKRSLDASGTESDEDGCESAVSLSQSPKRRRVNESRCQCNPGLLQSIYKQNEKILALLAAPVVREHSRVIYGSPSKYNDADLLTSEDLSRFIRENRDAYHNGVLAEEADFMRQ